VVVDRARERVHEPCVALRGQRGHRAEYPEVDPVLGHQLLDDPGRVAGAEPVPLVDGVVHAARADVRHAPGRERRPAVVEPDVPLLRQVGAQARQRRVVVDVGVDQLQPGRLLGQALLGQLARSRVARRDRHAATSPAESVRTAPWREDAVDLALEDGPVDLGESILLVTGRPGR
jgi:hypothetical protein